ncbi:MAG: 50S ribosomal protein L9, partial [Woeseiaceae bacterium]
MNVILLDSVENLGNIGDLVTVKPGFGRNYLLPSGKAALATKANIAEFEAKRADLEKAAAQDLKAATVRANLIRGMELVIAANVGTEGKLFGSVGTVDISEAFAKVGVEVTRSEVRMPEGPIHETGEYVVGVHLHSELDVDVTVRVV